MELLIMELLIIRGTMIKALRSFLLTGLLLVPMLSVVAQEPVAQVIELTGRVDVTRGEAPAQPLAQGDALYIEDIVRTKSDARVEIMLSEGSQLSLDENSRLVLAEYATGAQPSGVFSLIRGRLRSVVTDTFAQRRDAFQVRTSTALIGVQGTDFMTQVLGNATRVNVSQGVVQIKNIDPNILGARILRANQFGVVKAGEPPQLMVPFGTLDAIRIGSGGTISIQSDSKRAVDPMQLPPAAPPLITVPPPPNIPGRPGL